jgi:hypothetical protein
MRTVVAVTAPLLAAGPKALTQSPTARSLAAAVWVVLTGVELEVVTLRVSVWGCVGLVFFELLEEFDLFALGKLPGLRSKPETVSVVPWTAVTLPEAMARERSAVRKLPPAPPPGTEGRDPPPPFLWKKPPPPVP